MTLIMDSIENFVKSYNWAKVVKPSEDTYNALQRYRRAILHSHTRLL